VGACDLFDPLPENDLLLAGFAIVETICKWGNLRPEGLAKFLSKEKLNYKDPNNVAKTIDKTAHNYTVLTLRAQFGESLFVYGEEARTPASLKNCRPTVAIIDAVDGTDLLARRFANWCSAMIFFHPKQHRILAAIVGHSSGDIYYASSKGAFKRTSDGKKKLLKRNPDERLALSQASVCFYGQKPRSFLNLGKYQSGVFLSKLGEFAALAEKKKSLDFRLYNFAGNPMMVKMPERTVDVVFEVSGQRAHDVIPGVYIAMQAGAIFTDLNGSPIDPVTALETPKEKIRYILSATKSLATEMKDLLGQPLRLPVVGKRAVGSKTHI